MPSARLCIAAVVVAASLAACGSSSTPSTTTPASTSPASSGAATIKVIKVSGFGNALGTNSGSAVYMLSTDTSTSSKCDTACTKTWPPVIVTGKPTAAAGAVASDLGTITRSDGTKQVTYNGHPLYTFSGNTVENGAAEDGGVWYILNTSGAPIKHAKKGIY